MDYIICIAKCDHNVTNTKSLFGIKFQFLAFSFEDPSHVFLQLLGSLKTKSSSTNSQHPPPHQVHNSGHDPHLAQTGGDTI